MVVGFYELPEEDRPPEWMYLEADELEAHFERVREQRRGGAGREPVPQAPMVQNELTKGLRG